MKGKTIKSILRKKFNVFAESITDERVRKLVKNNSIITGGSIASLLLNEKVNDYDVYFTNVETVRAVVHYYVKKFTENDARYDFVVLDGTVDLPDDYEVRGIIKDRIIIKVVGAGVAEEEGFTHSEDPNSENENDGHFEKEDETKEKYRPVYISNNAITLSDQFQLIIRFFGDAEEIHSNYDFSHCKCYWTSKDGHLELPAEALECLLTKELRYTGSKYPLASIIRSRKFITRGFSVNAGQYLKMAYQLQKLNLKNLSVLSDQLTGIDAYWFSKMLNCVDEDKLKNDFDENYFVTLIDRFF